MAGAMTLARVLDVAPAGATIDVPKGRGKGRVQAVRAPAEVKAPDGGEGAGEPDQAVEAPAGKATAAERRRALALLLETWLELARDLACAQRGASASIRDVALLEELEDAARQLPPGAAGDILGRLVRATELLEVNATPELVLDVLLLRWPRRGRVA